MIRECVNCKYSRGLGSDVSCEHDPKGSESYMSETDCIYFEWNNDDENDKLNRLVKENEQLSHDATVLIYSNQEYRKENEQLKETIETQNFNYENTKGIIHSSEHQIQRLQDENEQLKKELKRCKDWINSDKNDYELTLSFIKNKGYSLKDVLEYEKELKK